MLPILGPSTVRDAPGRRNAWLQRREYQVHGGNAPEAVLPEEDSAGKPPEDNGGRAVPSRTSISN
jgi:ABC-type transporter lipoprotein component MlaA